MTSDLPVTVRKTTVEYNQYKYSLYVFKSLSAGPQQETTHGTYWSSVVVLLTKNTDASAAEVEELLLCLKQHLQHIKYFFKDGIRNDDALTVWAATRSQM